MLPLATIKAFADELTKIAAIQSEQLPVQSQPSQLVTTSLQDPLNSWSKTPSWIHQAPEAKKQPPKEQSAAKMSLPAREANAIFFRPPDQAAQTGQKRKLVDSDSAAKAMTREDTPIGAQSTANIAAGNTMSPSTGPGGV